MNFDDLVTQLDKEDNGRVHIPLKKAINFDDLKAEWDKEDNGSMHIPKKIAHLKKAQHPLDRLKRNMKREIYLQIVCLSLVAFAMLIREEDYLLHAISLVTIVLIGIISTFFLSKFYAFYKTVHIYNIETKDNLLDLYYNLKLNMERYKSFTFLAMCSFMMHQGITLYSKMELAAVNSGPVVANAFSSILLVYIAPMVLSILVVIVATNWWVNFFYGRYAKQIKEILDELKEA